MSATQTETSSSPYLAGPYAPVPDEVDLGRLDVSGALPDGLRGTFLRNGPNPMFAPLGAYHLFDGDGMLHAATFDGSSVAYRNRWIRSAGLGAEVRAGHAIYGGMAQPAFPTPELVGDAGPMKNVANTHVVRHAGPHDVPLGGGAADAGRRLARDPRHPRLRRRARRSDDRPSEDRHRDRRDALLRLLGDGALPAVPRRRRGRAG